MTPESLKYLVEYDVAAKFNALPPWHRAQLWEWLTTDAMFTPTKDDRVDEIDEYRCTPARVYDMLGRLQTEMDPESVHEALCTWEWVRDHKRYVLVWLALHGFNVEGLKP